MIDALAQRRFERIAHHIAVAQTQYEEHLRGLNKEAAELERLLGDYMDGLERITGSTQETTKIRSEIAAAFKVFADPQVIPALDAANQHFDTAAVELAQLVGALPRTP